MFVEGEVALKAFEFANLRLPMAGLSLAAYTRLNKGRRKRARDVYLPWAFENGLKAESVLNVYWEEELERDVEDLRRSLGIEIPPDLREERRKAKMQRGKTEGGESEKKEA